VRKIDGKVLSWKTADGGRSVKSDGEGK